MDLAENALEGRKEREKRIIGWGVSNYPDQEPALGGGGVEDPGRGRYTTANSYDHSVDPVLHTGPSTDVFLFVSSPFILSICAEVILQGENANQTGWSGNRTNWSHVRSIANGCLKYWPLPSDLDAARMAVNN